MLSSIIQFYPIICELDLLINFPECAIEVYKAIEKATIMTIYKWGQSSVKDCSDAFRHAYWMALISRGTVCGGTVARAFGVAHECDLPAGANDKNMDLFNNDLGISIAENNPGLSKAELANLLCNYINSGDFKIMADPHLPSEHLIFSTGCICK